jgi:hypothetical protein
VVLLTEVPGSDHVNLTLTNPLDRRMPARYMHVLFCRDHKDGGVDMRPIRWISVFDSNGIGRMGLVPAPEAYIYLTPEQAAEIGDIVSEPIKRLDYLEGEWAPMDVKR